MTFIDGRTGAFEQVVGSARPPSSPGNGRFQASTEEIALPFPHPDEPPVKFVSPNYFARIGWREVPEDAVVVSVFEVGGATLAEVHWQHPAGGPSNAGAGASCPTPVPVAINKAIDQLFRLRPQGFSQIVVRLERDDLWQREWGTLA